MSFVQCGKKQHNFYKPISTIWNNFFFNFIIQFRNFIYEVNVMRETWVTSQFSYWKMLRPELTACEVFQRWDVVSENNCFLRKEAGGWAAKNTSHYLWKKVMFSVGWDVKAIMGDVISVYLLRGTVIYWLPCLKLKWRLMSKPFWFRPILCVKLIIIFRLDIKVNKQTLLAKAKG